jgi:hypothetical protein
MEAADFSETFGWYLRNRIPQDSNHTRFAPFRVDTVYAGGVFTAGEPPPVSYTLHVF